MPEHVIKAAYSDHTIRVYQAYAPKIARPALQAGRFVPPFKLTRMTWIKPSFNWMMYRSHFATKPGQEVVLGIDITREGFEWALQHAVLSRFSPLIYSSHAEWRKLLTQSIVRVQWDPERDCGLNRIEGTGAIQIGLSGDAVSRYVNDWIKRIEDMTEVAHRLAADREHGRISESSPAQFEVAYPLNEQLRFIVDGHGF